jgi:hypothetical protein
MCAARQKQVKSPVQEVLPESKDSIAHPLVAVILAARVNNTKPETKSNKEGNNARPVAAMLATQVEEAVARPNSKSHDDVANPVAALCPYGQNHDYGDILYFLAMIGGGIDNAIKMSKEKATSIDKRPS